MKIAKNITELIGNTPLVELEKLNEKLGTNFVAKLEFFNPLSSIKDRIALAMIEDAESKGLLHSKSVIVEPTSGNTGIGLAYICAYKGYKLILTMPETMSVERQNLLRSFGAELILTPGNMGMASAINKANEIVSNNPNAFIPQQFKNEANPQKHFNTTGKEIWDDTDQKVKNVIAGVGTGGTISGVGRYLKSQNPHVHIIAYEPVTSSVISGGQPGPHKIQGVGAGFVPETLDLSCVDKTMSVDDEEAYKYTKYLTQEEGIFAGISSGAAVATAVKLHTEGFIRDELTVLIFPDAGERYISTKGLF